MGLTLDGSFQGTVPANTLPPPHLAIPQGRGGAPADVKANAVASEAALRVGRSRLHTALRDWLKDFFFGVMELIISWEVMPFVSMRSIVGYGTSNKQKSILVLLPYKLNTTSLAG